MKNRSLKKSGHRRQLSKEIIKMNLMNDMYPIPSRQSSLHNKSARHTASKIRNILDFLQFSQSQELFLSLFQQKIALELAFTPTSVQNILREVRIEGNVAKLVTKLVCSNDCNDKQTIFLLKGLISTTYRQVKELIELFFFYYFIKCHQKQYRTLMREFQNKKMYQAICKCNSTNSEFLKSKILSIVAMIYVKYGQKEKFNLIAVKVLELRRLVQEKYFGKIYFNIDEDYVSTTFYFSMKYIEVMLGKSDDNFELITIIKKEIDLIKEYYDNEQINANTKDIFLNEMAKYKQGVTSQLENNYFHGSYDYETVEKKKQRTISALKQYKEKKKFSIFTANKHTRNRSTILAESKKQIAEFKDAKSLENRPKSSSIIKLSQKFREVYNTLNSNQQLSSFSKISSENKIRKTKKAGKVGFEDQKTSTFVSNKDTVTNYPNLFTKIIKPTKEEEEKQKLEKKMKIGQIYKAFSNQNRILRDIPSKNLKIELFNIIKFEMGNKTVVREMYKNQIIQFSAGLENGHAQFQNILTVKSCLELQFIKLWISQPLFCAVKVHLKQKSFQVEVTINGIKNNVILHRGKNMLCERYLTIWPTIRYLVHKKIAQLTIFRHYESQLIQRKVFENQLTTLCSQFYSQKFGTISKEQIEQVNICLDNLIKLVLVLQHYKKNKSIRYELGKQYRCKILHFNLQDGEKTKLNMLSEIYLNEYSKIHLCNLLLSHNGNFYAFQLSTSKEKALRTINNKAGIQIQLSSIDLKKQEAARKTIFVLQWKQLERHFVFYEDFSTFFKAICSYVAVNNKFVNRFTNFISRRLYVTDHAIFKAEVSYNPIQNDQFMTQYRIHKKEIIKEYPLEIFNQFRINIVENQQELQSIRYSAVIVKQKNIKLKKKTNVVRTTQRSSRMVAQVFRPSTVLAKKKKKNDSNVKYWREQRKINNKKYLVLVMLTWQNEQQFEVQYTLVNRANQSKDILKLNHLDLEIMYGRNFLSPKSDICLDDYISSYDILACSAKDVQQINLDLALDVLNHLDFYHNHHIRKLYIESQNGLYSHCFKNKRKQQIEQVKRMSKLTDIQKVPYLSKFEFGCKSRISKVLKIGNRFGVLTFKRLGINNHTFWQIVFEFARNHIAHVCQIDEEQLTYLLSDYSRKNIKISQSLTPSGVFLMSSISSIPRSSRLNPDSLNISVSSKHEEYIDYKERIIGLFERQEINIVSQDTKLILNIKQQTFTLKQRIIAQWDYERKTYYSVWLNDTKVQVNAQYSKEDLDWSISSVNNHNSLSLKSIIAESLGKVELSYAYRFYEMENKEADEDSFELMRVCVFYFQWCKYQKFKYKYPHS